MPADVIVHRDAVDVGIVFLGELAYLARQLGRNPFVGVDLKYPFALAEIDTEVAPVALDLPGALHQAVGVACGDISRRVGAFVQDDDDLVGEGETLQTGGEALFFVVDHHQSRKHGPAHGTIARVFSHRSRAAASAASTLRLSIRLSVER